MVGDGGSLWELVRAGESVRGSTCLKITFLVKGGSEVEGVKWREGGRVYLKNIEPLANVSRVR